MRRQDGRVLVLGQRDERLVVRRLCRRRVYGVRRDVRVYAFDRLLRLDDRGERGLFRGFSAVAGADARAYDGSTVAGADVAAVTGADYAADGCSRYPRARMLSFVSYR